MARKELALSSGARLLLPEEGERAKGLVAICPGGGYGYLSPREADPVARAFAPYGLACAIVFYSVREREEQPRLGTLPIEQLGEAIAALRAAYPGKPVAAMGFSAGAHVVAGLGVHWQTLHLACPDALVLCYPVITAGAYAHRGSIDNLTRDENRTFYSLERYVGAHVPPTFLWHTAQDASVPVENSLMFASALSAAKVPFELHVFPYGGHGLSLATPEVCEDGGDPYVARWVELCARWMDLTLPGTAQNAQIP